MSNATISTVSIKDYIVAFNEEQTARINYEVILENNTDFIISRKTLKTERELVILISQGLYYIKDNGTKKNENVTTATLKSFFRNINEDIILNSVHWLSILNKDSIEIIESIISNDVYTDMCRHNVLKGISEPGWYVPYWKQNQKLFMKIVNIFPTISDATKYRSSIPLIFELDRLYGYNEAVYFAEKLVRSGVREFTADYNSHYHGISKDCKKILTLLEPKYSLQLRRLIDYCLFDLYAQGLSILNSSTWILYRDYLDMQIQFYGKIREKYPASLKTEHDIMVLKSNEIKILEQSEDFASRNNEIKDLAYEQGGYSVIIPEQPQDLVDEGISLSHCVGSYAERIINGECYVLFLRKTASPSESLVTFQVSGKKLCQAEGKSHRSITKEERKFLERWCNEKNMNYAIE